MDFKDNVVIITGASSGIGEAMAYELANRGARLALVARNAENLQTVADACEQRGAQTIMIAADVTDETACEAMVEQVVATYGRIDTLINNAGLTMWSRLDELDSLETFKKVIDVNLMGSVYPTYYALPYLKASKGRIVAMASIAGRTGIPTRTGYSASKHAVVGFFESLRIELEDDGVTVTIAFPDFVNSGFHIRALGPDGVPLGHNPLQTDKIMTSEICAEGVLDAVAARKRELIMSRRGRFGKWLKLIAPEIPDRLAKEAIEKGR